MTDHHPPRRIVTGHDEANVATVLIDAPAENTRRAADGRTSTLIWCTDGMPADIAAGAAIEDMGARKLGTAPPANGSRFAMIEFPPRSVTPMHRTETIDYVICITGEIDMRMDQSTVTLRAGDVMVQRGTNHAWANRSDQSAKLAFVLIDAKPLGLGHPVTGAQTARSSSN